MSKRKIVVKALVVLAGLFLLSAPTAYSQLCKGDFNCDGMVTGAELGQFAVDFGRQDCPTCGPAMVPKTGRTTSDATGDDGDLEKGVAWPNPRFTDNNDGTISDKLTGLMWAEDANLTPTGTAWQGALDYVEGMNDGVGTYGYDDWRLPNVNELHSLTHYGYNSPAVPDTAGTGQWSAGDPFDNVQSSWYWSSTPFEGDPSVAWLVNFISGLVSNGLKTVGFYVWPVRGGN